MRTVVLLACVAIAGSSAYNCFEFFNWIVGDRINAFYFPGKTQELPKWAHPHLQRLAYRDFATALIGAALGLYVFYRDDWR